jgi:hypothetical protein
VQGDGQVRAVDGRVETALAALTRWPARIVAIV